MNKPHIVGARLDPEDYQFVAQIAEREERTVSDVLRRIVRQAKQSVASADRQRGDALSVS